LASQRCSASSPERGRCNPAASSCSAAT
jgi:hypothetical protein